MTQTPEAIVRQWFREVWDEGSESAIDRLMHPEAVVYGLGGQSIRGPEQFKPLFNMFQSAFRDLQIAVARTIVQGDMVVAHCHVTGRHTGETLGGPPTGKPIDFYGITIARVKDGLLVEGWNCFDYLTMYQQVGWVTNPVLPLDVEMA